MDACFVKKNLLIFCIYDCAIALLEKYDIQARRFYSRWSRWFDQNFTEEIISKDFLSSGIFQKMPIIPERLVSKKRC
jgi:predicted DNA-binding helix-hairpin-helix protein